MSTESSEGDLEPTPDPEEALEQYYWDLTGAPNPDLAADPRLQQAHIRPEPVSLNEDDDLVPVPRVQVPPAPHVPDSQASLAAAAFSKGDFSLAKAHANEYLESPDNAGQTAAIRVVLPPLKAGLIFEGPEAVCTAILVITGDTPPDMSSASDRVLLLNKALLNEDPVPDYYPGSNPSTYPQALEHAALALLAERDKHALAAHRHATSALNSGFHLPEALSTHLLGLLLK